MAKRESKSSRKKNAPKIQPVTVLCRVTVKADCEKEFVKVLCRDWPGLLRLGLATKDEPVVYRHVDASGGPVYFQIFNWRSAETASAAHTIPLVMQSWSSMEPLLEERGGHGKWEFPHVEQVPMNWVGLRGISHAAGGS